MKKISRQEMKAVALGLAFLSPNILGFLAFIAGPLVISLVMAFTDWNLELHNVFKNEPVKFVGLENFITLFSDPDFFRYLGNTLFFMIGIPFGMGGSLCAALLLSKNFKGGSRRAWAIAFVTATLFVSMAMLTLAGMGSTAMTMLIVGLAGVILITGSIGGQTIYRTLFYFPHFTAGVATYILWKKMYSPDTGPINSALRPLLEYASPLLSSLPEWTGLLASILLITIAVVIFLYFCLNKYLLWRHGEYSHLSLALSFILISLPILMCSQWCPFHIPRFTFPVFIAITFSLLFIGVYKGRKHRCPFDRGLSGAMIGSGAVMTILFVLVGLSRVTIDLPQIAAAGLEPPKWIADYHWAKPSLMIMGFWGAIGSNNMLLYLAGLSGVPQDLYEAADIDGANTFQRFWHITWPQLANVTFFIFVMSVIGGLQGGFEMARTMTKGGPAGSTTTLSYYIYSEGFATGRLGYASAVAWTLFALTLSITLFNWKFGNRYTNE